MHTGFHHFAVSEAVVTLSFTFLSFPVAVNFDKGVYLFSFGQKLEQSSR